MSSLRSMPSAATLFVAFSLLLACAVLVGPLSLRGGPKGRRLSIRDNFDSARLHTWDMPFPEDWQILSEGSLHYLHMQRSRPPGVPRRPLQFARLKNVNMGNFALDVKVRRAGGSMIVVFNYVDTLHFYYVHLSENPGTQIAVHNGIFIVNGAPRKRIAGLDAAPALPDLSWHDVRIVRNVRSGSIKIFLDKQTKPRFSVIDRTFKCGQIGLGSFDETGDFAQLRLRSDDARCLNSAEE